MRLFSIAFALVLVTYAIAATTQRDPTEYTKIRPYAAVRTSTNNVRIYTTMSNMDYERRNMYHFYLLSATKSCDSMSLTDLAKETKPEFSSIENSELQRMAYITFPAQEDGEYKLCGSIYGHIGEFFKFSLPESTINAPYYPISLAMLKWKVEHTAADPVKTLELDAETELGSPFTDLLVLSPTKCETDETTQATSLSSTVTMDENTPEKLYVCTPLVPPAYISTDDVIVTEAVETVDGKFSTKMEIPTAMPYPGIEAISFDMENKKLTYVLGKEHKDVYVTAVVEFDPDLDLGDEESLMKEESEGVYTMTFDELHSSNRVAIRVEKKADFAVDYLNIRVDLVVDMNIPYNFSVIEASKNLLKIMGFQKNTQKPSIALVGESDECNDAAFKATTVTEVTSTSFDGSIEIFNFTLSDTADKKYKVCWRQGVSFGETTATFPTAASVGMENFGVGVRTFAGGLLQSTIRLYAEGYTNFKAKYTTDDCASVTFETADAFDAFKYKVAGYSSLSHWCVSGTGLTTTEFANASPVAVDSHVAEILITGNTMKVTTTAIPGLKTVRAFGSTNYSACANENNIGSNTDPTVVTNFTEESGVYTATLYRESTMKAFCIQMIDAEDHKLSEFIIHTMRGFSAMVNPADNKQVILYSTEDMSKTNNKLVLVDEDGCSGALAGSIEPTTVVETSSGTEGKKYTLTYDAAVDKTRLCVRTANVSTPGLEIMAALYEVPIEQNKIGIMFDSAVLSVEEKKMRVSLMILGGFPAGLKYSVVTGGANCGAANTITETWTNNAYTFSILVDDSNTDWKICVTDGTTVETISRPNINLDDFTFKTIREVDDNKLHIFPDNQANLGIRAKLVRYTSDELTNKEHVNADYVDNGRHASIQYYLDADGIYTVDIADKNTRYAVRRFFQIPNPSMKLLKYDGISTDWYFTAPSFEFALPVALKGKRYFFRDSDDGDCTFADFAESSKMAIKTLNDDCTVAVDEFYGGFSDIMICVEESDDSIIMFEAESSDMKPDFDYSTSSEEITLYRHGYFNKNDVKIVATVPAGTLKYEAGKVTELTKETTIEIDIPDEGVDATSSKFSVGDVRYELPPHNRGEFNNLEGIRGKVTDGEHELDINNDDVIEGIEEGIFVYHSVTRGVLEEKDGKFYTNMDLENRVFVRSIYGSLMKTLAGTGDGSAYNVQTTCTPVKKGDVCILTTTTDGVTCVKNKCEHSGTVAIDEIALEIKAQITDADGRIALDYPEMKIESEVVTAGDNSSVIKRSIDIVGVYGAFFHDVTIQTIDDNDTKEVKIYLDEKIPTSFRPFWYFYPTWYDGAGNGRTLTLPGNSFMYGLHGNIVTNELRNSTAISQFAAENGRYYASFETTGDIDPTGFGMYMIFLNGGLYELDEFIPDHNFSARVIPPRDLDDNVTDYTAAVVSILVVVFIAGGVGFFFLYKKKLASDKKPTLVAMIEEDESSSESDAVVSEASGDSEVVLSEEEDSFESEKESEKSDSHSEDTESESDKESAHSEQKDE